MYVMKSIENGDIRWYAFYNGQDITPVAQGYGGKTPLMRELGIQLYPTNSNLIVNELYGGSLDRLREEWEYLVPAEPITKNSWEYENFTANEFKWLPGYSRDEVKRYIREWGPSDQALIRKEIKEVGIDGYVSVQFTKYPVELNRKVNDFVAKWGWYPSLHSNTEDAVRDFIKTKIEYRKYTIKISRDKQVL